MQPVNLQDYQEVARENLTTAAYDYYVSGAHDEVTLARNRQAFEEVQLLYRVMVDVSHRDPSTTVLGQPVSFPVLLAPTAFHGMACRDGELATARAARRSDTIMILSTLSNRPLEEVAQAAEGRLWFQLYVYRDREATRALVQRAEQAGCRALVVTVDAPLLGCRERDVRNQFHLPSGLSVVNLSAAGLAELPATAGESGLAAYFYSLIDPALTWKDLEWLRSITTLPVLVKGVVRADDAVRAVEHGASGIVVSNHGGRQLDTSPATIEVMEPIAEAVDGRVELLLDGGVRRGTDVIKALALGARAVLIGRPVLWGLAAAGEEGAHGVLEMLRAELDLGMALCGAPRLSDLTRDLVHKPLIPRAG